METIDGIAKIEKLVGEYNIWELKYCPYGKFKVRIYLDMAGRYCGYSNIQVSDGHGTYNCAVGHGRNEEEALKDTIADFFLLVGGKSEWDESDFQYGDPVDF